MVDVYFRYTNGNEVLCNNIESIEVATASGYKKISGDELLNYKFGYYDFIHLYSETSNYSVLGRDLLYCQITKL